MCGCIICIGSYVFGKQAAACNVVTAVNAIPHHKSRTGFYHRSIGFSDTSHKELSMSLMLCQLKKLLFRPPFPD